MFNFEVSERLVGVIKNPIEVISLTKRNIMSFINGLYDPLGLAVPFTVTGKLLMRRLWTKFPGMGWNDRVVGDLEIEWINYFLEMTTLPEIFFTRFVKSEESGGKPDLILFSDASTEAYCPCCYLRWSQSDGNVASRLLIAKSRVAPIKIQTIVRLEL